MGHLYRPTYTRPVPAGATSCKHRKKPAVRWKGRGGRLVVGVLCDDKPGRCLVESGTYRISYRGPDGEDRDEPAFADRDASSALLAERVRTSSRVAAGLLPPEAARPRLTISDLLARWHAHVASGRATATGAARQLARATAVCTGVGATRPADLTAAAVTAWMSAKQKGKRFGPNTAANHISATKSFTRWCCLVDRSEPVDHLSGMKVSRNHDDTRINRRALAPDELDCLLDATRASTAVLYGLTGPERHALYLLACSTGLRAAELSSLTAASFGAGCVVIEARAAKNRKRDTLPVPEAVASVLAPVIAAAGAGPLWPNRPTAATRDPRGRGLRVKPSRAWWRVAARMVRVDLAAAGVAAETAGKRFDFHSLRGQFATDLDREGVTLTRAQKLMRHSTPVLTSRWYTHPDFDALAADVAKLKRGQ